MSAQTPAHAAPARTVPSLPATPASFDAGMLRILRARLELQRDFRIDQLAALQSMAGPVSPPDPAHHEVVESLTRGAVSALRETRQAIWRLDEGCYGRCVDCTEPLDMEQLAAVPQASRCPRCERVQQSS